jgi:hypothetical protein
MNAFSHLHKTENNLHMIDLNQVMANEGYHVTDAVHWFQHGLLGGMGQSNSLNLLHVAGFVQSIDATRTDHWQTGLFVYSGDLL